MKKLFFSYRRPSWPFTQHLAFELERRLEVTVFVDFQNTDSTDFEYGTLRSLRESDAMLVIVSEHTFAPERIHQEDDWVRREIREALRLDIPILMACIDGVLPPPGLPEDIGRIYTKQAIRFYPEFFEAGLERLADFIGSGTTIPLRPHPGKRKTGPNRTVNPLPQDAIDQLNQYIDRAASLLDAGSVDDAISLLDQLLDGELPSAYQRVIAVMREKAEAASRYAAIAKLVEIKSTRHAGCQELGSFRRDHPTFGDPQNLRSHCPKPRSVDLLPKPFAWVDIPAGPVTLRESVEVKSYFGTSRWYLLPHFMMGKYPVTNAQYLKFVEDGGYQDATWWTIDGWRIRQKHGWSEPQFWSNDRWNLPDHPVIGVSWYEAMAFCQWLRTTTGENISLPTEQQWQRAAQGNLPRLYPWGDHFDPRNCNCSAQSSLRTNGTTPVTKHVPHGESPFGLADMAGNVWEWCVTIYDTGRESLEGTDNRVQRGGSWKNEFAHMVRTEHRRQYAPQERRDNVGFRLIRMEGH